MACQTLITDFELYLRKTKKVSSSTIKNYRSDLRLFLSWLEKKRVKIKKITPSLLERYKNYLLTNNIAKNTLNRKLATVRVFCQFCHYNGLFRQNPAQKLANLSAEQPEEKKVHDLVSKFGAWLKKQRASHNTIKNYTADVRQYLLHQWET